MTYLMTFTFKPWQVFVLIQLCGVLLFAAIFHLTGWFYSGLILGVTVSVGVAWRFHDEPWWYWIHLGFLPAVVVALQFDLPAYFYLIAFIVTWFVYGQIARSRVPLFLSEKEVLAQLAETVPYGASFLDIGAGTGRVLKYLAIHRPDLKLYGVEMAWLPWLIGRLSLKRGILWFRADYHDVDFSQFDCIYAYLSPAVMAELWVKAKAEMKVGSRLMSNSFTIDNQTPTNVIALNDWKNGKLLIWQM
jgi:hypothetical protein